MKKIITLILTIIITISISGCNNASQSSSESYESTKETVADEKPKQSFLDFNKEMNIENPVTYDKNGLKFTAVSLEYLEDGGTPVPMSENRLRESYMDNFGGIDGYVEFCVKIENSSGKDLYQSDIFVINGITIPCELYNGGVGGAVGAITFSTDSNVKSNSHEITYSIRYADLIFLGIHEISDIQILWYYGKNGPMGFHIEGTTGFMKTKVTNSNTHDDNTNYYQKNLADFAAAAELKIVDYSNTPYTFENGIKVLSTTLIDTGAKTSESDRHKYDYGEWITDVWLELENTSKETWEIEPNTKILNDQSELVFEGVRYIAPLRIGPGKKTVLKLRFAVEDRTYKGILLRLNQKRIQHSAYDGYTDPTNDFYSSILIGLPNTADSEYKFKGTEIYNKNGIEVSAKPVIDVEFRDVDVYFFIKSDKLSKHPLEITSFSINGKTSRYTDSVDVEETLFVYGNKSYVIVQVCDSLLASDIVPVKSTTVKGTINGDQFTAEFTNKDAIYRKDGMLFPLSFLAQE